VFLACGGAEGGSTAPVFFPLFCRTHFLAHPINTEAVTYVINRSASLAALFYLLSVLTAVKNA